MRTQTQTPPTIPCNPPIVDFDPEDLGRPDAQSLTPLQAEIDAVRETIRLNWQEMECFEPSHADWRTTGANIARLIHILNRLLAVLAQSADRFSAPETQDSVGDDSVPKASALSKCYFIGPNFGHGVFATNAGYATVAHELLEHGVPSVCITDSNGKLVLPDGQVRLRLNPTSAYAFHS